MLRVLHLSLKAEFFNAIRAGTKDREYRLVTPYWTKRLVGREYDRIELTLGYPARDDQECRISRPWRGFTQSTICHPHFGQHSVWVFAIDVSAAP